MRQAVLRDLAPMGKPHYLFELLNVTNHLFEGICHVGPPPKLGMNEGIDAPGPAAQGFLDKENRWLPWYWSEHGISYNTNLIPPDRAPKDWQDLCNPAYKGQVSFDPPETRFMVGLYILMGEEKFRGWLKCMGENQPIIQRGHTQRMNLMLAGDHGHQQKHSKSIRLRPVQRLDALR